MRVNMGTSIVRSFPFTWMTTQRTGMESRKFDNITKALASGTSRRGVLKGALGGAIGGAIGMLGLSRGAAQPQERSASAIARTR